MTKKKDEPVVPVVNELTTEKKCESSQLDFIRYDHTTNTFQAEFKKGKKYNYYDVPVELWNEALAAESIGRFMNEKIKGKFEYKATELNLL
jgi:hypothetical protein